MTDQPPPVSRVKLGQGVVLPGAYRPRRWGRFSWDVDGLYIEPGRLFHKEPELLLSWAEVKSLKVEGSEAQASTSSASYRKSFQVRHTRGTVRTTQTAVTHVFAAVAGDEFVIRLSKSPARMRSLMGPVLSRYRQDD